MTSNRFSRRRARLQYIRFAVQAFFIAFVAIGYMVIVHRLPAVKWSLLAVTVLAGPLFCSWVCPLGTAQEWLRAFGKNVMRITWKVPVRVDRYLTLGRYVIAALFFAGIIPMLFTHSRGTMVMLLMGKIAGVAAIILLGAYLLLSLFVDRPYCKYACWFGAVDGALSVARVFGLRRNADACLNCGKCDSACQMGVEVSALRAIRDPHCINCGKCLAVCPEPSALTVGFAPPSRADFAAMVEKYKVKR